MSSITHSGITNSDGQILAAILDSFDAAGLSLLTLDSVTDAPDPGVVIFVISFEAILSLPGCAVAIDAVLPYAHLKFINQVGPRLYRAGLALDRRTTLAALLRISTTAESE